MHTYLESEHQTGATVNSGYLAQALLWAGIAILVLWSLFIVGVWSGAGELKRKPA